MNRQTARTRWLVALGATAALSLPPLAVAQGGSDDAFNQMLSTMAGQDTGSQWFNYYVKVLNLELAQKASLEPYGAAGPEGPTSGFNGYINNFVAPDTGSMWFNDYVDRVNDDLREKQRIAQ